MTKTKLLAAIALSLGFVGAASAQCVCRCVDGRVQPICRSSLDIPPICAPQICRIVPPSIAPIPSPGIPPIGTSGCRQAQVFNPITGRYEWRTVCR